MKDFNTISGITHLAKVTQQPESIPTSVYPHSVVPVSVPNYLGGATIAIAVFRMIAVAVQAAGFISKSNTHKRQTVATKNRSFANQQPHTSGWAFGL